MLVVNAGNLEKNLEWLNRNNDVKAHIEDKSKQMSLLAIQGPSSRKIVSDLTQISLEDLKYYQFIQSNKFNSPITISRTGYTGELGYEMYCSNLDAGSLWDDLLKKGKKYRLVPTGLGARDLLRMEMKYCLYGNDIDETTHPFEAGLGWVVALDKDEFIGKEALIPMKEDISRRLICFQMEDRAIPRKGYTIWINDKERGVVTSGGFSSVLNMGVGMGYVNRKTSKAGNKIGIDIRGNVKNAIIKKPPLYTHGTLYS
jgi:aminomethyltransferase